MSARFRSAEPSFLQRDIVETYEKKCNRRLSYETDRHLDKTNSEIQSLELSFATEIKNKR
jgi:hypothetical protein